MDCHLLWVLVMVIYDVSVRDPVEDDRIVQERVEDLLR